MCTTNVNQKHDRGFQADLARRMGITRQAVSIILSGKVSIGKKMAKRLEEATGIPRLSWLYPETYHNPMLSDRNSPTPKETTQDEGKESWPQTM
jgi:plasmid maintenance system antidote protein VapI